MKIETKYNIGSVIWIPGRSLDTRKWIPRRTTISAIQINVYGKAIKQIHYHLYDEYFIGSFYENQLFETKSECQAECDKRNME